MIFILPPTRVPAPTDCEGRTYKQIGDQLFISHRTVQYHLKELYRDWGVTKATQAILKGRKFGLLG